ncbi:hypothetical protein MP638_006915 [Amoeboaphelidium occidentale]|nr:hypothetical protein MP638_006915 [Amoeboaphelidium occidentale]
MQSTNTLFITRIPARSRISAKELAEFFTPFGQLVRCDIPKPPVEVPTYLFAFVEYERDEDAKAAFTEYDKEEGLIIAGERIKVQWARDNSRRRTGGRDRSPPPPSGSHRERDYYGRRSPYEDRGRRYDEPDRRRRYIDDEDRGRSSDRYNGGYSNGRAGTDKYDRDIRRYGSRDYDDGPRSDRKYASERRDGSPPPRSRREEPPASSPTFPDSANADKKKDGSRW